MSLKQQIDQDLKGAMLGGEKTLVETLRGIKSAILNAEIASNKRDTGLSDDEMVQLLTKEAKKRQESAELFKQGGNDVKAQAELDEKAVIQNYLPDQLSESETASLVDEVVLSLGDVNPQMMGQIIAQVRQKAGAGADGALIARLVKEKIS